MMILPVRIVALRKDVDIKNLFIEIVP